jgi:2-iminoacetate synthase
MKLSKNAIDFIDDGYIHGLLGVKPDAGRFREVVAKSLAKHALTLEETAVLLNADAPDQVETLFETARELKRAVYGNRIVLFAPLYVGNRCVNDCAYCGFRRSNAEQIRRTLDFDEIRAEVKALEDSGQKRLILVYGEHPAYSPEYIAESVRTVYSTRSGNGEIRRVNINAAPLDHEGFATVKASGIGTYQVFQETYHKGTYAAMHPANTLKGNYMWRLDAFNRAMEAGIDDVGIGALIGLYDWRFEVLGLVAHALHLQKCYGVGPHTISFPRMQPASGLNLREDTLVSDDQFKRLVAVLRLAVPYTGMILTCRENAEIRREVLGFGVSQIDAGTRLEIGGYTELASINTQKIDKEQFRLGDMRSLDDVTRELMVDGFIPSFCTACYRLGRTGETFMEYAIPGFIQNMCTPNAMTTLMEYLTDYASPETRAVGGRIIEQELAKMPEGDHKTEVIRRLSAIRNDGERDLYF